MMFAEFYRDLNVQDEDGWTPLMFAAKAGSAAVVQYLIQRGAKTNLRQVSVVMHSLNWYGMADICFSLEWWIHGSLPCRTRWPCFILLVFAGGECWPQYCGRTAKHCSSSHCSSSQCHRNMQAANGIWRWPLLEGWWWWHTSGSCQLTRAENLQFSHLLCICHVNVLLEFFCTCCACKCVCLCVFVRACVCLSFCLSVCVYMHRTFLHSMSV